MVFLGFIRSSGSLFEKQEYSLSKVTKKGRREAEDYLNPVLKVLFYPVVKKYEFNKYKSKETIPH